MGYLSDVIWKDEYKYHNTPEGEDCLKKVMYVTKYSGIYAVLGSSLDILLYSHPKGYGNILARYAYNTFPLMGMGAAFAAGTCAATNLRKKDDKLNYAIGAWSTAAVWGAWRKSFKVGIYGGIGLTLIACLYKDHLENGWNLLSTDKIPKTIHPWYLKRDFTLTEDPGKTYRTQ